MNEKEKCRRAKRITFLRICARKISSSTFISYNNVIISSLNLRGKPRPGCVASEYIDKYIDYIKHYTLHSCFPPDMTIYRLFTPEVVFLLVFFPKLSWKHSCAGPSPPPARIRRFTRRFTGSILLTLTQTDQRQFVLTAVGETFQWRYGLC